MGDLLADELFLNVGFVEVGGEEAEDEAGVAIVSDFEGFGGGGNNEAVGVLRENGVEQFQVMAIAVVFDDGA